MVDSRRAAGEPVATGIHAEHTDAHGGIDSFCLGRSPHTGALMQISTPSNALQTFDEGRKTASGLERVLGRGPSAKGMKRHGILGSSITLLEGRLGCDVHGGA